MGDKIIDEKLIVDLAPDAFSRYLSNLLIRIMGFKKLNDFYHSLPIAIGEKDFASTLLDTMKISRIVKGGELPKGGPFVAVVPVVSGILEVVASIAEIIESSGRNDVKILPINDALRSVQCLSPYILDCGSCGSNFALLSRAVHHLESGGGIIYFVKINSHHLTFDSDSLIFPYKLSRITGASVINVLMDFDANLNYSWTTFLGKWFYQIFSIRRFIANSCTSMLVIFDKPFVCSETIIDERYVQKMFKPFFESSIGVSPESIFNLADNMRIKFKTIVSRGTK